MPFLITPRVESLHTFISYGANPLHQVAKSCPLMLTWNSHRYGSNVYLEYAVLYCVICNVIVRQAPYIHIFSDSHHIYDDSKNFPMI